MTNPEPGVSIPKPKQYAIVVDDMSMSLLSRILPSLQFVEIHGMTMQGVDGFQFLLNPLPKTEEKTDALPS